MTQVSTAPEHHQDDTEILYEQRTSPLHPGSLETHSPHLNYLKTKMDLDKVRTICLQ